VSSIRLIEISRVIFEYHPPRRMGTNLNQKGTPLNRFDRRFDGSQGAGRQSMKTRSETWLAALQKGRRVDGDKKSSLNPFFST
jgi:hypothetical protein